MKILFVIDAFFTHSNGTSISGQRYAAVLREMGHEVRVISTAGKAKNAPHLYGWKEEDVYKVRVLHTPFTPLLEANGYQFAKPEKKVIRRALEWCDVAHVLAPFWLGCRVKNMAQAMGKPLTAAFHIQAENMSSAVHLGKVEWFNRMIYRIHFRTMFRGVDYVHCPSHMMADELRHYGYDNRLHVISNGISDDFTYYRPADEAFPGKIVITMVGRLSPEKRQDLLIEAARLSKYADVIQLRFAGTGTAEKYYRKLSLKLQNPPVFGYYKKDELISLLHATHLYVHASDMESEAIGCIEAFATGLVPIISDSPLSATKQFALDERSLFRAGDAADLARKIDYWIEHPDERKEMEKRYAASAEKYRLHESVAEFEKMLKKAIL